jgi:5'(3')-deoxyribonucleotidase
MGRMVRVDKVKQICLDMDGVIANWTDEVFRLFDKNPNECVWGSSDICNPLGITVSQLWSRIDEQGDEFWQRIEPYPWASQLWIECSRVAPTIILTSPSYHASSLAGKLRWLNEHFGSPFRDYLMGPQKHFCARPGSILIDDFESNCSKFEENGGLSILFPQVYNANSCHANDPVPFVLNELARLRS